MLLTSSFAANDPILMKRPVLKRNSQHAFAAELQIMEGKLKKLMARLKATRKDEALLNRVDWVHVGAVKYMNAILDEVLAVELTDEQE
jgi:hypothetical protein